MVLHGLECLRTGQYQPLTLRKPSSLHDGFFMVGTESTLLNPRGMV